MNGHVSFLPKYRFYSSLIRSGASSPHDRKVFKHMTNRVSMIPGDLGSILQIPFFWTKGVQIRMIADIDRGVWYHSVVEVPKTRFYIDYKNIVGSLPAPYLHQRMSLLSSLKKYWPWGLWYDMSIMLCGRALRKRGYFQYFNYALYLRTLQKKKKEKKEGGVCVVCFLTRLIDVVLTKQWVRYELLIWTTQAYL